MAGTHVGGDVAYSATGVPRPVYPTLAAGDVGFLIVHHSNTTTVPTTPSGWTLLASHQPATGFSIWTEVYVRTMAGTETGSIVVDLSGSSKCTASVDVWRGITVPTSGDITFADVDNSAVATTPVPAVTFTGSAQYLTATSGRNSTPPTSPWTVPAGTTLTDAAFGTGGGAEVTGLAYSETVETDGSIGAGTWGRNNTVAMDWTTMTIAVKTAVSRVTKTGTASFNTLTRTAAKTGTASFDVQARATKTGTASFNVQAHVSKTGSVTFDVAGATGRVQKNATLSYDAASRATKTGTASYDVAAATTRVTKSSTLSYNTTVRTAAKTGTASFKVSSVVSEATWPVFIAHRGGDPGPEETLYAYAATYTKGGSFWHEGDLQITANGTLVANHDDTVDRMYSSGPVATGLVSSVTDAQWALERWRVNTGYTGSERPAMFISEWVAAYGPGSGKQEVIGLWEVKAGTDLNAVLSAFSTMKGQIVLECDVWADAQAAAAAGWETGYWTQTPDFAALTAAGVKYVMIDHTNVTTTMASQAIAAGVKLVMYTVNSVTNRDAALAKFSDTSYAGFMTNKPQTVSFGATRVTKTGSASYDTLTRTAAKTGTVSFNDLFRPAAKTGIVSYADLFRPAAKTGTVSFNDLARGTTPRTLSYNVAQRTSRTGSVTFDVGGATGRIQKNATVSYNLASRGSGTRTLSYNVLQRASKTGSISYAALLRGGRTGTITFNTLADAVAGMDLWFSDGTTMKRIGSVVQT